MNNSKLCLPRSDYDPTPPPPAGGSPSLAVAGAAAATLCRFGVHQLRRHLRSTHRCYPSPLLALAITTSEAVHRCGGLACGEGDAASADHCAHSTVTTVPLQKVGYRVSVFVNRTHASFTATAIR